MDSVIHLSLTTLARWFKNVIEGRSNKDHPLLGYQTLKLFFLLMSTVCVMHKVYPCPLLSTHNLCCSPVKTSLTPTD